jgi:NAD-dependent SIR2 family protein deacetylase
MARTVFILGAGASVRAGAPTMDTFIDKATAMRAAPTAVDQQDIEAFDLVFRARKQLLPVYAKARIEINNIESLFGVFEMAALLGRLGNLSSDDVKSLPAAMSRMIARTIEASVQFPVERIASGIRVLPAEPYNVFARLISDLRRHESVALITFNYDLCLDYALHFNTVAVDYCLMNETVEAGKLPLLKLHGSLNWGRCQNCDGITPWHMHEFFKGRMWLDAQDSVRLELSNKLQQHSHCGGSPLKPSPVIVPPTWNKGRFHTELSTVWRAAAKHLSEAERIVVIGYSFPKTDEFFHYFYALGSVGEAIPCLFCLVNKDSNVATRFDEILGPTVSSARCCRPINGLFEESVPKIADLLGAKIPVRVGGS